MEGGAFGIELVSQVIDIFIAICSVTKLTLQACSVSIQVVASVWTGGGDDGDLQTYTVLLERFMDIILGCGGCLGSNGGELLCVICIQEFMVVGGGGSYVGHLALWDFFLLWLGSIFLVAKLLFSALMLRCLPALDTDSLAMITM